MGCDVHAFIEARRNQQRHWFTVAKLYLSRNYDVFARLAGVRGAAQAAVVAPRGLPADVSPITSSACMVTVVYAGELSKESRSISASEAAKLVEQGKSRYYGEVKKATITFTPNEGVPTTFIHNAEFEGFPSHITEPDFHTFTWLTVDELRRAINDVSDLPADYIAALRAMSALHEAGDDVRIVLWFDN
jgi:hypothetical protein